jgi:predicted ester cyclase
MVELTADERIELQRDTVAKHVSAENAKDWAAVHQTFLQSTGVAWDCVPLSTTFRGIDGVVDVYSAIGSALPDLEVIVTGEYHTPGVSIIEATLRGSHQGEYCDVEPKGHPVSFEVVGIFVFGEGEQAGKLVVERAYWDNETVLRQMRGEADAPTGVGLAERAGCG